MNNPRCVGIEKETTLRSNERDCCLDNMKAPEHGRRLLTFEWSMAELKEDLGNWADAYKVHITMNSSEPGTVWMVFRKDDSGD